MQVTTSTPPPEGRRKNFFLDNCFHRMSEKRFDVNYELDPQFPSWGRSSQAARHPISFRVHERSGLGLRLYFDKLQLLRSDCMEGSIYEASYPAPSRPVPFVNHFWV
jgi:hypothetical protein